LDNEYKEYFLSLGLRFLYKLPHRSTYKERRKLIAGGIYTDFDFFVQAVADYMPSEAFVDIADEEAQLELCGDDGNGPNEAWLWSNDYTNFWFPNDGCKDDLREWAIACETVEGFQTGGSSKSRTMRLTPYRGMKLSALSMKGTIKKRSEEKTSELTFG